MALCENRYQRLIHLVECGRVAFEAGRYLQAVFHWEQSWREESGPTRQLMQGLMQAAGAYRKLELAQPLGMFKLLLLAIERIGPIPDGFAGLRLDDFRAGLERSRREAIFWVAGGVPPGRPAPLQRVG
jgi:predicted metal-dependent hydrolase